MAGVEGRRDFVHLIARVDSTPSRDVLLLRREVLHENVLVIVNLLLQACLKVVVCFLVTLLEEATSLIDPESLQWHVNILSY